MASTVPSASASTPATSISEGIEPTLQFRTIKELNSQVAQVIRDSGDVLIVTGVSPDIYKLIQRNRCYGIRLRRYYVDTQTLIITLATHTHEQLHRVIWNDCLRFIDYMGLGNQWEDIGTTTFREEGHPDGDGGEGDSAGGPYPVPPGRKGWPTLVIEAGYSESSDRLKRDMEWWFAKSNHEVKIVILAKFNRQQQEIFLDKYEEELQVRPTTRFVTAQGGQVLVPVRRQEISITRNTTTNPTTYNVARGALSLSFRLLFLRNPDPTRGERDLVWSIAGMERYAERVWSRAPPPG